MADVADAVQQQLALLRASFGEKLVERMVEIEAAAVPLTEAAATPEEQARAVDTLQALSHKLTGSAGTFGFDAISVSARKLERCSGALKEAVLTEADKQELLVLLADLVATVAAGEGDSDNPDREERADITASAPERDDDILNLLYFGDRSEAIDQLSEAVLDFGFQIHHTDAEAIDGFIAKEEDVASIVDLDSMPWSSAAEEELSRVTALCPVSIALSTDGSFERRLTVVRSGFDSFLVSSTDATAVVEAVDKHVSARRPDPYRVLIVDDDPELAGYVEVVLDGAGMIARSITDPFAAMDAIHEFHPELIMLDLNMPGCSGAELAAVIRQQDSLSSVSIVFLSSEEDPARQIAAMHSGGDDFLPKSLRAEHLISAVEARAKRFRQLRSMLVSDSLTGLLNHSATRHQIETEIARARREKSGFSLVFIDIDHFKAVNDTYGHGVGDEVIRSLALLLKQRFRTTDVIGRMGGEEFGLVLSGAGRADATRIVNEVREAFAAMQFQGGGSEFSVTFSAGVSFFPGHETVKDLCDAADLALYRAKDEGRNRLVLAS